MKPKAKGGWINRCLQAPCIAASVLCVCLPALLTLAAESELPQLPCRIAPYPEYPPPNTPPNVVLWSGNDLRAWVPPACTGWMKGAPVLGVALAGYFSGGGEPDVMLSRLGSISALNGVRYWSVTDKKWETLFTHAYALAGPDAKALRADFAATDFRAGNDLYFLSADNRTDSDMITHIHVISVDNERIVWATVNASPLRAFFITAVPAGGIETFYALERTKSGWHFYSLTRISGVSSVFSSMVHGDSYINRAVAMYRYIASIPTDRETPTSR